MFLVVYLCNNNNNMKMKRSIIMSTIAPKGEGVIVLRSLGYTKSGMHTYYHVAVPAGGYVEYYVGRYDSRFFRIFPPNINEGRDAVLISFESNIKVFRVTDYIDYGDLYAYNSREREWRKVERNIKEINNFLYWQEEDNCLYKEYLSYNWQEDYLSVDFQIFKGIPKYDWEAKKHFFEKVNWRAGGIMKNEIIDKIYVSPEYNERGELYCYRRDFNPAP
ncbi:MAG: hypothetical protein QXM96_04130 [Candidatus Woesearchaeota archaeon]